MTFQDHSKSLTKPSLKENIRIVARAKARATVCHFKAGVRRGKATEPCTNRRLVYDMAYRNEPQEFRIQAVGGRPPQYARPSPPSVGA